ncbi:MAG: argininosuccinate synthase [Lentisphaerae bacterium]|jgi:argininosuccinate synthase|nr:argininosuccinate synthase [Lentisphaerota bacterium]MBT4816610.1 argininosuccinate synthase [Lentisphaerota bacterium]MBT5610942.1 argininosuccinate synthase [Lentisphaerota bacterium]MBT7053646.1 argininosuccinate synthase [Lentisphaerota bacterium]MBT7842025.1 argininosuccinate synthase [Lentisphaerota bacterium]
MKVVLAYSGGLDTSVILTWLRDVYDAEVITFCADLGQEEELDGLEEKALRTGASKCYVEDLTDEFARDFIFPMMQGNAIYEGSYLLGTSIARPLIAKRLVEIAKAEGAEAISHGATGKGNDQVRFELTAYALQPDIKVIAPWREWNFKSRTDLINYAEEKQIPITVSAAKPYSMDRNLLHISFEGGVLEDPWAEPTDDIHLMTSPLSDTPDTPEYVIVSFDKGNPVAVNETKLGPADLMRELNRIAGRHGVGRIDIVENRFTGMKDRGVYETPGGTVVHQTHRALEGLCMDREAMHLRDSFIPQYASMIYNGFWYAPEREMLQAAITESQKNVTGDVRCKLFKGACHIVGRRSPTSLYKPEFVTFEEDNVYNQADADGFIKLNALRLRLRAMSQGL